MPQSKFRYVILLGLPALILPSMIWADTRSDAEQDLQDLNRQLQAAEEDFASQKVNHDAAARDLGQLRQTMIRNTSRVQELESKAAAAEENLEITRRAQAEARTVFTARQEELGHILAAMQRLGAEPAASILLAPGGAEEAARASLLLDGLMSGLRDKAQALRRELDHLSRLEATYREQQDHLALARAQLNRERVQLDQLVAERQRLVRSRSASLIDANARVAVLATKALSMRDLVDQLRKSGGINTPDQAFRVIPVPRANPQRGKSGLSETIVRIPRDALVQPVLMTTVRFQKQRGGLKLPVSGRIVFAYGDRRANGQTVHGLTLNAIRGARVRAPADGKIVFAGPFRSYGNLIILSPANGYHLLLAGLGSTDVQVGQWLLAGEPVGRMAEGGQQKGVFTPSKTSLYIELRKDGEPINPAPWFNSVPGKVTGS